MAMAVDELDRLAKIILDPASEPDVAGPFALMTPVA